MHTALGAVREGAQAVDNLSHLLRAKRVGPRVLSGALAEVRESCAGLSAAFAALEAELCPTLHSVAEAEKVARELLAGGAKCARLVSDKLAVGANPDARARLELSELAARSTHKLDKVIFVLTALAQAAHPERTVLDAVDVLRGLESENGSPLKITLSAHVMETPVFLGDCKLVGAMIRLALSLLLHAGETLPHLEITPHGDAGLCLSMGGKELAAPALDLKNAGARRSLVLAISVLEYMPQDEAVLRSIARLSSIDFQMAGDGRRMRFLLSRTDLPGA